MKNTETLFKERLIKHIKKKYPKVWIYKTNDRTTNHIPDIIMCFQGRFVALELKVAGNIATPGQRAVLQNIKIAEGVAATIKTVADFDELLKYNFL